nr:hypothetical protein [Diadegma semiclausum ichnovirus]
MLGAANKTWPYPIAKHNYTFIHCIGLEGILICLWIRIAEKAQHLFSEPRFCSSGHTGCYHHIASPICLLPSFFGRSLGCLGLFPNSFVPSAAFGRMLLCPFFVSTKLLSPTLVISTTMFLSPVLFFSALLLFTSALLFSPPLLFPATLLFAPSLHFPLSGVVVITKHDQCG